MYTPCCLLRRNGAARSALHGTMLLSGMKGGDRMSEQLIIEYYSDGLLVVEEHEVPLHVPGLSLNALVEFAETMLL
jgi:hypothetical protein